MLRIVLVSIGALIFSSSAFADSSAIKASNNQISIQTISTNVDYTETGNGRYGGVIGKLDTESGDVPGYAVAFSVMGEDDNKYFAAEYNRESGQTTYTGMPMTGGTFGSIVSTSTAVLTNYSVRFGKGFIFDDPVGQAIVTPFFEIGSHKWDRGLGGGISAPYNESYTHDYFGIGTLGQFSPVDTKLVFSASALIGTTLRSQISIANGTNSWEGSLGNSAIEKFILSADYELLSHLHGNVSVDFTSFNYGISGAYPIPAGISWEPDSKTNYTTIKLGLGYAF
jgi:hypothetical protein